MTHEALPSPRVDVVVATRNRPELLRLALDAIWEQTYAGEIVCHVVFDQCDPDESVARSSANRTITVMNNERTPGLAGGRNSGILAGSASSSPSATTTTSGCPPRWRSRSRRWPERQRSRR